VGIVFLLVAVGFWKLWNFSDLPSRAVRVPLSIDPADDTPVHSVSKPRLRFGNERPLTVRDEPAYRSGHPLFAVLRLGNAPDAATLVALDRPDGSPPILWLDTDHDHSLGDETPVRLEPYPDSDRYYRSRAPVPVRFPVRVGDALDTGTMALTLLLDLTETGAELRVDYTGRHRGELVFETDPETEASGYAFLLYDADVSGCFDPSDLMVIDTDGDGVLSGERNSVELYRLTDPFFLEDRSWEVVELSPLGDWIEVAPSRREAAPRRRLAIGDTAPDFEVPRLGGGTLKLSDYRGRPVFLKFWATW
jgi:hypothetical protein